MPDPKVTLEEWRQRVNAGRNSSGSIAQPSSNAVHSGSSGNSTTNGVTPTKGSGNPLHPDISEEVARLRETVLVLKGQIYGSSSGGAGMAQHITEIEDRVVNVEGRITTLEGHLGALVAKFAELLQLLGVDEESDNAQAQ